MLGAREEFSKFVHLMSMLAPRLEDTEASLHGFHVAHPASQCNCVDLDEAKFPKDRPDIFTSHFKST
jgi:hypothetical protein